MDPEGGEVIRVTVAGDQPRVTQGQPVRFEGLEAIPWSNNGKSGRGLPCRLRPGLLPRRRPREFPRARSGMPARRWRTACLPHMSASHHARKGSQAAMTSSTTTKAASNGDAPPRSHARATRARHRRLREEECYHLTSLIGDCLDEAEHLVRKVHNKAYDRVIDYDGSKGTEPLDRPRPSRSSTRPTTALAGADLPLRRQHAPETPGSLAGRPRSDPVRMPGQEDSHSSGPAHHRPSPIAQSGKGVRGMFHAINACSWRVSGRQILDIGLARDNAIAAAHGWQARQVKPGTWSLPRPAVRPARTGKSHGSSASSRTCSTGIRRHRRRRQGRLRTWTDARS